VVGALERARAAEAPRLEFGESSCSLTIESELAFFVFFKKTA